MSAVAIGLRTAVLQHVHLGTAHIATVPAAVTCLTSTLSWMDHARLVLETSLPTALLPHVQLAGYLDLMPMGSARRATHHLVMCNLCNHVRCATDLVHLTAP